MEIPDSKMIFKAVCVSTGNDKVDLGMIYLIPWFSSNRKIKLEHRV